MSDAENTWNNAQTSFNKNLGILSTSEFSSTPYDVEKSVSSDVAGEGTDTKNEMEQVFMSNVNGYLSDTFSGVLLNNVGNTNGYLQTNLARELENAQKMYKNITNQIEKSRLSLIEKEYSIHYNAFLSKIYQITTLVIVLTFLVIKAIIDEHMQFVVATILLASIWVAYSLFLVVVFRRNGKRYSDKWDKYYFSEVPKSKKKVKQ